MSRFLLSGLAALFITCPTLSYAQQQTQPAQAGVALSEADSEAITDRRVEVVKLALAMRPEQERLWPAVEEAIRARSMARHQRLVNLAALRAGQIDRSQATPIDLLRARADGLAERAAGLKKLADAWQPLYATLDENQKLRLRFLAAFVLREMRNALEARKMWAEEEYETEEE